MAAGVELALDHEDDLVLVVGVGVEHRVGRGPDLEHLEPIGVAGMVEPHLAVELAGRELLREVVGHEVPGPPERLAFGTTELDPRHLVLLLDTLDTGRPTLPGPDPASVHSRLTRKHDWCSITFSRHERVFGGMPMGTMRILDHTGDTTVAWSVDDPESVAHTARVFDRLTRECKIPFARAPPVRRLTDAERVRAFDPAADEIVWVRPVAGG